MFKRLLISILTASIFAEATSDTYFIEIPKECENRTICDIQSNNETYSHDMASLVGDITSWEHVKPIKEWPPELEDKSILGEDDCEIIGGKGDYIPLHYFRDDTQADWQPAVKSANFMQYIYVEECEVGAHQKRCFDHFSTRSNEVAVCEQGYTPMVVKVLKKGTVKSHVLKVPTYCSCKLTKIPRRRSVTHT